MECAAKLNLPDTDVYLYKQQISTLHGHPTNRPAVSSRGARGAPKLSRQPPGEKGSGYFTVFFASPVLPAGATYWFHMREEGRIRPAQ